ncbi:hypothetical protein RIF29_18933 [Crotalaria pallida]|uniref:Uncharacterized protein n=1 Tax=Crotalaria pallida TaxID=3830 RepID=A0AAN9I7A0_CROPI
MWNQWPMREELYFFLYGPSPISLVNEEAFQPYYPSTSSLLPQFLCRRLLPPSPVTKQQLIYSSQSRRSTLLSAPRSISLSLLLRHLLCLLRVLSPLPYGPRRRRT